MALTNIVTNIDLDVYDHDLTPTTIKAIALDSKTRYVAAALLKERNPYGIPQTASVTLTVLRPDNTGVQVTGSTYSYDADGTTMYGAYAALTRLAIAIKGTCKGQFKITDGEQILRTEIFAVNNGQALDADITDWAGDLDGHNLDEMAESIETLESAVGTLQTDVATVKEGLSDITGRLQDLEDGGMGLTSEQKSAVLAIARAVAYKTENGDQLYSDLYDALYAVRIRYTVANSLTHCSSNNNATSIMEGYSYSAVLTPSSGYELSSVQIMMGGVNITASVYENGAINIAEVTGNVAITATATKILPDGYTALEYVTADGNQYINTGIAETENISAEYDFSLNADSKYGTGNHILSSTNVYMPFLRSTYTETDHARNLMVCNRGQSAGTETAFQWSLNRRYAFKAFMSGTNNIVIDNAQVASVSVGNTLSAQNSLYLFAYGNAPTNAIYRFNGNLYSMRLYNSSGTLIHRYLPCLDSNNVAGLYDTVSQTFLHSESGTELIAGGAA